MNLPSTLVSSSVAPHGSESLKNSASSCGLDVVSEAVLGLGRDGEELRRGLDVRLRERLRPGADDLDVFGGAFEVCGFGDSSDSDVSGSPSSPPQAESAITAAIKGMATRRRGMP